MNYQRTWANLNNAVGFAAECARLALSFYKGDHRRKLVRAIEIAEAYGRGEYIDPETVHAAAYAADVAIGAATDDSATYATTAAADAAHAIATATAGTDVDDVVDAVEAAIDAGVDPRQILDVFVQWWARDVGVQAPSGEARDAVTALLIIGEEKRAVELVS